MLFQGVLSATEIILPGPSESYIRFGHAMANLGDINSDNLEGLIAVVYQCLFSNIDVVLE